MLDGIDYYPKRKKRKKLKFFLLFIIIVFVWFIMTNIELNTRDSVSIIVNEPESLEEASESKKMNADELPIIPKIKPNVENLDEVIQTYEASTYD